MALRADRQVLETDISNILNDVADEGEIVCYKTSGSGNALGENANIVSLYADPSGKVPAGLLLNKFVNIDQTVRHRNFHNGEQIIGEKAPLMRKGWVVTNELSGTPTVGATAYLTANGQTTVTNGGLAATPKVGQYMSIKDEDGYAKLYLDLPVV